MKQGYVTVKNGKWEIKPDAPQWAKDEFAELMDALSAEPDEDDIVTQY